MGVEREVVGLAVCLAEGGDSGAARRRGVPTVERVAGATGGGKRGDPAAGGGRAVTARWCGAAPGAVGDVEGVGGPTRDEHEVGGSAVGAAGGDLGAAP